MASTRDETAIPDLHGLTSGKFEHIIEAATDGVVTLDNAGRYTYANAAAERILGIRRSEILQRRYNEVAWKLTTLKGQPLLDEETPFKRALQDGKAVYDQKCMVERPDGEKVVITTNAAPLYDEQGNVEGVVGIVTDITEWQELQDRNNAFLHTVAHDLRIPITVIQGYAELLTQILKGGSIDTSAAECLAEILKNSEKMEAMIEELLDTARIEGARLQVQKEAILLAPFFREVLAQTCRKSMNIERLAFQIPETLPTVLANPEHLERILLNLISNAVKFSPEKSTVTIQARTSGDEILISVSDRGRGITPEERVLLFQRFGQISGLSSPDGVGLGLYITRLLVEAHEGRIWIESKLGQGSTFHFTLPVAT